MPTDTLNDMTALELNFVQAWHQAVYDWMRSGASERWIPSDYNLLMLIEKLESLGLVHALDGDKVAALNQAFRALQAENALQPIAAHLN